MKMDTDIPGANVLGLVLLGLVGGAFAIRAVRQRRTRSLANRVGQVWAQIEGMLDQSGHSTKTTLKSEVRRRLAWAAASAGASVAARRFAARALSH